MSSILEVKLINSPSCEPFNMSNCSISSAIIVSVSFSTSFFKLFTIFLIEVANVSLHSTILLLTASNAVLASDTWLCIDVIIDSLLFFMSSFIVLILRFSSEALELIVSVIASCIFSLKISELFSKYFCNCSVLFEFSIITS